MRVNLFQALIIAEGMRGPYRITKVHPSGAYFAVDHDVNEAWGMP